MCLIGCKGGIMEKIIELLWYSHLMENPMEQSEGRKQIVEMLATKAEHFRECLTAEQIAALDSYELYMSEISDVSEKEAFAKGVRFATKYLLDALYGK